MQVEFIESAHIYLVDGVIVPSVTQIMKPMSETYYQGISADRLSEAANRGTRVHKAVYDLETAHTPIEDIDPDILPYVKNYLMAKHIKGFIPIRQEFILTEGTFCGTLDMLAEFRGKQVIIDLKATSKLNKELAEVQLAGYTELCEKNGIKVEGQYILHLTRDGYRLHEIIPNQPMWKELKDEAMRTLRED